MMRILPWRHARTHGARRWRRLGVAVLVAVTAGVIGGKITASANGGAAPGWYQVQAGAGLNEHSGPGTGYSINGYAQPWSWLNLDCSKNGDYIDGDPVWDHIQGTNSYVTDAYMSTPPWYQASLPNCITYSPPAPFNPNCGNIWMSRWDLGYMAGFGFDRTTNFYFRLNGVPTSGYTSFNFNVTAHFVNTYGNQETNYPSELGAWAGSTPFITDVVYANAWWSVPHSEWSSYTINFYNNGNWVGACSGGA